MNSNKREMVSWSNKLSCGIKIIDEQHKGLVDLVNDMFNHATGNSVQEHDYFNRVIHEALKYVKNHFSTEEKIIIATKYPEYAEHKKEHDAFVLAVANNMREYQSGNRLTLSQFTRFLRDWILSHIAYQDKRYFEYFKKIATRKSDGKLSISSEDVMKS
ncbi:MAG: bacteriohemerythrin [Treponema sp.]|nr:bacteriohemerythrin [Treponema sp.]